MSYAFSIRRRSPFLLARFCSHAPAPPPFRPRSTLAAAVHRATPTKSRASAIRNGRLFTSSPPKMASDDDYAAFLEKANQDTSAAPAAQSTSFKTKAVDSEVPQGLLQIEEYYVSDTDEPFEPVSLKWDADSIPSEAEFAKLIGHSSDVSSISEKDFDPQGQYAKVLDAVKQAGSQAVAFFRVQHGSTRVEYYVVSLDKKGGKIVGLKAVAIES